MPVGIGGIIGAANAPNTNSASGVWSLRDQQEAAESADWPFIAAGQDAYTTPGTYSFVAPAGVYRVSVVAVGAGGGTGANSVGASGGTGGGLGWRNNIRVVPGQSYEVQVGAGGARAIAGQSPNGGDSYFQDYTTVVGFGGLGACNVFTTSLPGGKFVGDGGGNGGAGGSRVRANTGPGGGGAGGYSGPGGNGGDGLDGTFGDDGLGGSGGGGGCGQSGDAGGSGGGVGILGEGASGQGGGSGAADGGGGFGGSGGSDAGNATRTPSGNFYSNVNPTTGGNFGGGGAGSDNNAAASVIREGTGGNGAVRIIYGTGRAFPSTNTGDI